MSGPNADWTIRILYDGLCPLCSREMALLRRKDRGGRLQFEDIATDAFDPAKYGLTVEQSVAQIHGVLPDGRVLRGVDVFVLAYRAVGWGWLARLLEWRPTRPLVDRLYRAFARIRPRLSKFDHAACASGRCAPRSL